MSAVEVALDDLVLLRDSWNDDISPSRLRADSALLRKLLLDGLLGRAWRQSGRRGEPRVLAPDLKDYLGDFPRKDVVLAQAGGATYRGLTLVLNMVMRGPDSPGVRYSSGVDPLRELPLSRFVDGPTLVANGVTVKRRDLIQYVANKLGCVHYDERRKSDDVVFRALDDLPQQIVWKEGAGGFDIRYYEMLAMGQLLVMTPEIAAWLHEHGR